MTQDSLKAIFRYSTAHQPIPFSQAHCLLTINVGQEIYEGDQFSATIDLVNNTFGTCTLLINDTLQRHIMALEHSKSADYFEAITLQTGEEWLKRNQSNYKQLTNLHEILRWDRFRFHPDFLSKRLFLQEQLKNSLAYRQVFNEAISKLLHHYTDRLKTFNWDRAYGLCYDYLLEECTALCLWPELKCHYEVCVSPRNATMTYTHTEFVLPEYPDLLHSVDIRFKKIKQLKHQETSTHDLEKRHHEDFSTKYGEFFRDGGVIFDHPGH